MRRKSTIVKAIKMVHLICKHCKKRFIAYRDKVDNVCNDCKRETEKEQ